MCLAIPVLLVQQIVLQTPATQAAPAPVLPAQPVVKPAIVLPTILILSLPVTSVVVQQHIKMPVVSAKIVPPTIPLKLVLHVLILLTLPGMVIHVLIRINYVVSMQEQFILVPVLMVLVIAHLLPAEYQAILLLAGQVALVVRMVLVLQIILQKLLAQLPVILTELTMSQMAPVALKPVMG